MDLAGSYGITSVLEPSEFVASRSDLLDGFQRVIQWMLLFTLIQALVGVVNTLLLSVGERRREFGLLRAAGATRSQVQRLVLIEGASFAVIGTALGLVAGVVIGVAAIGSLKQFGIEGLSIPVPVLTVTAFAAVALGVLAAVVPARWAAAIPALDAVSDSGDAARSIGLRAGLARWSDERRRARMARAEATAATAPPPFHGVTPAPGEPVAAGAAATAGSVPSAPAAPTQPAPASAPTGPVPGPFAPGPVTPPPPVVPARAMPSVSTPPALGPAPDATEPTVVEPVVAAERPTVAVPDAAVPMPPVPAPNEPAPNEPAPNEPAPNEPLLRTSLR